MRITQILRSLALALSFISLSASGAAVRYVNLNCLAPTSPYTTWATAATNIQDAIDTSVAGDEIIVTNGIYRHDGRAVAGSMTNRVAVTAAVAVRSVNGPEYTFIQGSRDPLTTNGDAAVRCVYLTNGAVLAGFTLTNGATRASGDVDAEQSGGGVWCPSTLASVSNCVLTGNSAAYCGGGSYFASLRNCTLSSNRANVAGGGAFRGQMADCTFAGNWAAGNGGGVYFAPLTNCVLSGNFAGRGAGSYYGTLLDCVVTGNVATNLGGGADYGALTNCLITGNQARAGGGVGDATLENCVISSNLANTSGGGAYYCVLSHCLLTNNAATNAASGWGGGAASSTLRYCQVVGNTSAHNGGGVSSCQVTNCTVRANTARSYGGGANGGSLNSCVLAENTAAEYGGGMDNATLTGCVLSNNAANSGGGSYAGWLSNCVVLNNRATNNGGGADHSALLNCRLNGNSAAGYGGGVHRGSVTNCSLFHNQANNGGGTAYGTVVNGSIGGNSASSLGGGAASSTMINCVIWGNTASASSNTSAVTLSYSCTQPYVSGTGNLATDPRFVNLSAGDLRLQSNSPCTDAGTGVVTADGPDLDGNARFSGLAPDLGATEFQSGDPFYAWRLYYTLPTDGSADYANPDSDGLNNWQEWIAGTDPTNALSALRIVAISNAPSGAIIQWNGVANRTYWLESATNLAAPVYSLVASNLAGQDGILVCADTNSPGRPARFYRVGVTR